MGNEKLLAHIREGRVPEGEEPVDLSGFDLSDLQSRNNLAFNGPLLLDNCIFDEWPFSSCRFMKGLQARNATFRKRANVVVGVANPSSLNFSDSLFLDGAYFQTSQHYLDLSGAKIIGDLVFSGELGAVTCKETSVSGPVLATRAQFTRFASFEGLRIRLDDALNVKDFVPSPTLDFKNTKFSYEANFSKMRLECPARFDNVVFASQVTFEGTIFNQAPSFHGATLHPETRFDPAEKFDQQFPDTISTHSEARYRVLKELLTKQQALGEQLGFARLEMKAHMRKLGLVSLHRAYALLSDFGLSWARPTMLLFLTTVLAWYLYGCVTIPEISRYDGVLMVLAVSNAFPFVGALKSLGLAELPKTISESQQLLLALIIVVQNILSAIYLFLIGLGIRNRLRMK